MAVPSNRVPVRVARGLKSALTANVSDLLEGEVVYAKDEDRLYVIEGGSLVAMGADLGLSSIGDLSDVDTTTAAPTDKQGLVWNNANSEWEPGDLLASDPSPALSANLDLVTFYVTTTTTNGNLSLLANGTGAVVVRGNTNPAKLTLNCEVNTHGVSISSPPHSAGATYSLVLPTSAGSANQVLKTDGSGNLDWVNQTVAPVSIDDLNDVDTTSVAPTNGQALVWDSVAGQWEPGTISGGGGSIDSLSDVDTSSVAPTNGQALVWNSTTSQWEPGTVSGGGGGGGGIGAARLSESGTAASGVLTLTGLGSSGILHTISTDTNAWVVFYGSAADRTADSSRTYGTDPTAGSGVLAEAYVTTSGSVLFTPGTSYLNNDTSETEAIYLAVRDQAGTAVNATLTVTAYVSGGYDGVSGGTYGSG